MTSFPEGEERFGFFQQMHSEGEPFRYSARAIERLRHDYVTRLIARLAPQQLLEIGCSLGLLTRRLRDHTQHLTAIDLVPAAITRARSTTKDVEFAVANCLSLPFANESFDVVLASDGPMSWYLTAAERAAAYREMRRVVKSGGCVVVTEYLRPRRFDEFVREIADADLHIEDVSYLYNRPWYSLERALNKLPFGMGAPIVRSTLAARAVCALSRIGGKRAAHHAAVRARAGARAREGWG